MAVTAQGRPALGWPALGTVLALRWAALGTVLALLAGLCRVTGYHLLVPSGSPGLAVTVLAGAALAGVLAAVLVGGAALARISAAVPQICRAAALREKSWRAAFGRQRDPDAAGRPRPRAPAAAPAAAQS
jgi:Family of unknown function (DUF6412)